jgi:hypothetical protein
VVEVLEEEALGTSSPNTAKYNYEQSMDIENLVGMKLGNDISISHAPHGREGAVTVCNSLYE